MKQSVKLYFSTNNIPIKLDLYLINPISKNRVVKWKDLGNHSVAAFRPIRLVFFRSVCHTYSPVSKGHLVDDTGILQMLSVSIKSYTTV